MKTSASSRRGSFREIEHTADLGIEITAADLPALFAVAGEALFSLIVQPESVQASRAVAVSATGSDLEDLLHAWLRELLAHFNINDFVARSCEVTGIGGGRVEGIIAGETLDLSKHAFHTEIKGVTYHDFKLWQQDGAWHARIIFDV
jgi:SHS2 domain-containing protein